MLLEQAGFLVKVAIGQDGVRSLLGQAEVPYSLIVVCYTVPEAEKQWVRTAADASGAPIHQLTPLVLPAELLRQTEALVRIQQVHSKVP